MNRNSSRRDNPPEPLVFVNGRFRVHKTTGVQRYASELASRLHNKLRIIEPFAKLKGFVGHAWEQSALPLQTRSGLLWSPCNTGPCWVHRQVVTIHDVFPLDYPKWYSPRFVSAYKVLMPKLLSCVQRIIAVSEYTKQRIIANTPTPPQKVVVIPSGVANRFCPQPPVAIAAMRKTLCLPDGPYFLCVGSLEPRKNLVRTLKAWKLALPHLPTSYRLVVAGGVGNHRVLSPIAITPNTERVIFAGYVDEAFLPALYVGAEAFLFPSLAEGFGFPLLEAMACGTPVIAPSNSSLTELAGDASVLIDENNEHDICRAMCEMARTPSLRRTLGQRGLERVKQFSFDETANRTWRVLESEAGFTFNSR